MKVYPIFLNSLHQKKCIVIGGDHEAEGKVEGLLACDAGITVIAESPTDRIREWAENRQIEWIPRGYQPGDLKNAFLAIAVPSDPDTNGLIFEEGEAENALVNVMDDIPNCNFVAGSVVRRDPLVISISTSGAAPAFAVRIREQLERQYPFEFGSFLNLLQKLREPLARRYPDFSQRKRIWYELVDSDVFRMYRDGDVEAALRRIEQITGISWTAHEA